MIRSIGFGLVCLVLSVGVAGSQPEKKEDAKKESDGITFKADYIEKQWGIKFKSATLGVADRKGEVSILLMFSKDVENVKEMQQAFKRQTVKNTTMVFYFFDKEDIVLLKQAATQTVGELTGKEGDSFRVVVGGLGEHVDKIKKIEPRQNKAESKAKGKGK